jgi:hypothetical protein
MKEDERELGFDGKFHLGWESIKEYEKGLLVGLSIAFAFAAIFLLLVLSFPFNIICFVIPILILIALRNKFRKSENGLRLIGVLSESNINPKKGERRILLFGDLVEDALKRRKFEYSRVDIITEWRGGVDFKISDPEVTLRVCFSERFFDWAGVRLIIWPTNDQDSSALRKLKSIIEDFKLERGAESV